MLVADPGDPVLGGNEAHHLGRVLRLRPGETVIATDGKGTWTPCRYVGGGGLEPVGPVCHEPAPARAVTVAFSLVKGERPEWAVQKLTELGVDRIVLLSSARTVVHWPPPKARASLERLRRVAAEAACQSRRVWLPALEGVVGLEALDPATSVLAEPGGPPLPATASAVAVGPEGGWSPEELSAGFATAGLGPHVLRAETAAVAAGVLLVARRAGTVGSEGL